MLANQINIFVVDADELSRTGFCLLFEKDERLHVSGSAANIEQSLSELKTTAPHLLMIKTDLDDAATIDAIERAKATSYSTQILVLLESINPAKVAQLVAAHVRGIGPSRINVGELLWAVRTVASGSMWMAPAVADILRSLLSTAATLSTTEDTHPRLPTSTFTERENEILKLIADGMSNAQIAQKLQLSVETVKTYVRRIMDKSSIRSRRELLNSLDQPAKAFKADKGTLPNK